MSWRGTTVAAWHALVTWLSHRPITTLVTHEWSAPTGAMVITAAVQRTVYGGPANVTQTLVVWVAGTNALLAFVVAARHTHATHMHNSASYPLKAGSRQSVSNIYAPTQWFVRFQMDRNVIFLNLVMHEKTPTDTGVSTTTIVSDHQYAVISLYDGLERTLLTAHSLLRDLLLGTHFQPTSATFTHTLLSVATWKLICLVALDD